MTRIGDPLVWRASRHPEHGVVSHYKYALSDDGSFEKDEWGPWVETLIPVNDPQTGEVHMQTVLRTDPMGVDLVKSYPDIKDDPGVEDWLEPSEWKMERVFNDIRRWNFYTDEEDDRHHKAWDVLRDWHHAHPLANDVLLGSSICVGGSCVDCPTSPMSWKDMWDAILRGTMNVEARQDVEPVLAKTVENESETFLHPCSKRVDREKLSSSANVVELNRVTSSHYTKKQQRIALLSEKGLGRSYVAKSIDTPGALFFIKLGHYEGEFKVGLARRTFDPEKDDVKGGNGVCAVEWFERKNKKEASWGRKPRFRLSILEYDARRKPIYSTSVESVSDFLPIEVKVTKGSAPSSASNEPSLSQDCMDTLRSYMKGAYSSDDDHEDDSARMQEHDPNDEKKVKGTMRGKCKVEHGTSSEDDSSYVPDESEDEIDRKRVRKQPKRNASCN